MEETRQMDAVLKENVAQFLKKMESLFRQSIKKDSPTIVIHAGLGMGNTGDDALMLTGRQLIRKIYPSAKIIALCHNPKKGGEEYPAETEDMTLIKFKSFKMLKAVFSCDAYLVSGGGVLTQNIYHKGKLARLLEPRGKFSHMMMILQNLRKKPAVALFCGYSAEPDAIQALLIKLSLKNLPLLGVRGYTSEAVLKKLGINNYIEGYDPVFLYSCGDDMIDESAVQSCGLAGKDYVLINVRRVIDSSISERVISELSGYILNFHEKHPQYSFVFQPYSVRDFKAENDVLFAQEIKERILKQNPSVPLIVLEDYQTTYAAKGWAKNARMMLLARHHALVLTYEYNVPTIALSYNIKTRDVAEYAGYHSIVDYEDITAERLMEETKMLEEIYRGL